MSPNTLRSGLEVRCGRRVAHALVTAAVCLSALAAARGVTAQKTPAGPGPEFMDRAVRTFLLTELFEAAPGVSGAPVRLDGTGWIGGDYNRLWLNVDAEQPTSGRERDLRGDVNYGRLISPFWNALVGVRVESRRGAGFPGGTRALLHLGLEGLAPYWLTMEPSLYVSSRGEISGRLATTYDLLLSQRLILQPRLETRAAVQSVPQYGFQSGLTDTELGLRLRYEIRCELAPYVGVYWFRRIGGTAALARRTGEAAGETGLVAGLRVWH